MANHLPKGRERMRALGRLGGRKSGEARRNNAFNLRMYLAIILGSFFTEENLNRTPDEIVARFEHALKPKRYGGSHKNDWRCSDPSCRHRNSTKSWACAKCKRPAPLNGRLTRDALDAKEKEHRTLGYLRKFDL
jgi:hypothetical protein